MPEYLTATQIIERATKIIPLEAQKTTVMRIAGLISMHLKRLKAISKGAEPDDLPTLSQVIIASSGSGKTYLISQLAKAAGIGFYTIDASTITPSGYKGVNLHEALWSARAGADSSLQFETGIVLFDEFDKLAYGKAGHTEEYSAQANFLILMEGKEISFTDSRGSVHQFSPSKMLFLFAGAFQGLDEIVQKRVSAKKCIGFCADSAGETLQTETVLSQVTLDDIEVYGFNRELLGRIGSIHYIPPLTKQDFQVLLREGEHSIQGKYNRLFSSNNISFRIADEAADLIASQAETKNMGARAVNTIVMEKMLEAVQKIDEDRTINGVALNISDSSLVLEYTRKAAETDQDDQEEICDEADPAGFAEYMDSEKNLNLLCMRLLSSNAQETEDLESEIITFYFLQLALRFLWLRTEKNDWNFSSLEKIAQCTVHEEKMPIQQDNTTFDVLMGDFMENLKNDTVYDFNMLLVKYLFRQYKRLEDRNSSAHIIKAIKQAKENW